MRHKSIFFIEVIFFFGLAYMSFAEDYNLHYFLSKASSKTIALSEREKMEVLRQLDGVMRQARRIRSKLIRALQTGETDVRYQEGRFWISKLEEDGRSIEEGIQQIKLLKEKAASVVASIKLYRSLKDLSSNFNAYNNSPSFSASVGDLAPEMELWVDPVFYKLYLLPLARSKDVATKEPQRKKKPVSKQKRPVSKNKKP